MQTKQLVHVAISLLLAGALLAGCTAVHPVIAPAAAEAAMPAPAEDVVARAAQFKPLDMAQSTLLPKLAPWELAVLGKLVQAADLMDAAYWQQVGPVVACAVTRPRQVVNCRGRVPSCPAGCGMLKTAVIESKGVNP